MIDGTCLCGQLRWRFDGLPDAATACNCTACRRYGALWAYGFDAEAIAVSGTAAAYVRGESLGFHFCPRCGCLAYWRAVEPDRQGRRRMAVNLRLTEPGPIADVPIDRFDGLDRFEALPRDGTCIRDLWA